MLGGIDVGTTGCKITIYENDGTLAYQAYRDYPVTRTGEHEVRNNPSDISKFYSMKLSLRLEREVI